MDKERLRAKGWSEAEIAHAARVMVRAQERQHPWVRTLERGALVMLLLLIGCGVIIAAVRLIPVFAVLTPLLSVPIALVLGLCMGALLVSALRDLKPTRVGHTAGMIVAAIACLVIGIVAVRAISRRLDIIGGLQLWPWMIASTLVIGMLIPYAITWRTHGPA